MAMATTTPTEGTLVPKTQALKNVSDLLTSKAMMTQLRLALPKGVTAERLVRIALTEIRRVPALLECTRESLLGAVMQCAQLGLEPGTLGQCWIIPYGKEATFVPGYRGLSQLAYRSGQITSIAGRAVFDGDVFAYDFGQDEFTHKPCGENDPSKLTHVYAVIHTKGGGRLWDVMTRADVEKVRARSAASTKGPWVTDYVEMAKKTVLRRLFKIAPCSAEMNVAMSLDDAADVGAPQGIEFSITADAELPTEVA